MGFDTPFVEAVANAGTNDKVFMRSEWIAAWNRQLSYAEMAEFYRNPYQILKLKEEPVYNPLTATATVVEPPASNPGTVSKFFRQMLAGLSGFFQRPR